MEYEWNISFIFIEAPSGFTKLKEIKQAVNEAALKRDDDLIVDCESLTYAHGLWKSHSNALVGKLVIIVIMIIPKISVATSLTIATV